MPKTNLFCILRNMARCVNSQNEFEMDAVAICPVHYFVHICKGGETCYLTNEGTCIYTNKSFDGLARTQSLTVEGSPDAFSNADALTNYNQSVKRKAQEMDGPDAKRRKNSLATDSMDLETFINNVHRGLMHVEKDEKEISTEEEPQTYHINSVLANIHTIMGYNKKMKNSSNVMPCKLWVQSTIQALRAVQGKSLIPNMTSIPSVKAIVLDTIRSMEAPKQLWYTKKACITRQWQL